MSRAVIAKDLVVAVGRSLKMPGLVRAFEALARQACEEHWGYEEYLHEVLCNRLEVDQFLSAEWISFRASGAPGVRAGPDPAALCLPAGGEGPWVSGSTDEASTFVCARAAPAPPP